MSDQTNFKPGIRVKVITPMVMSKLNQHHPLDQQIGTIEKKLDTFDETMDAEREEYLVRFGYSSTRKIAGRCLYPCEHQKPSQSN